MPSVTELLCDLGLASQLVGRTGFCIHPREVVRSIPKVGGTKDVNVDRIRELAPTHLVVNIDENRKETVEELAALRAVDRRHAPARAGGQPRRSTGCSAASSAVAAEAERLCGAFSAAYADLADAARRPQRRCSI